MNWNTLSNSQRSRPLIVQGRFKTSDYVGMFYEACPEAYEAKPGRISSEKFPFLKNADLSWETSPITACSPGMNC